MYKLKAYSSKVPTLSPEGQKRFNLVKSLSENFTVSNTMAEQLDHLLFEQLFASEEKSKDQSVPASSPKYQREPNKPNSNELEQRFNELFQALKNHSGFQTSEDNISRAVKEFISETKIGLDQLSPEVRRLISSEPQLIRYEFSDRSSIPFQKPEIGSFQMIVDDIMMGNNVMLIGGAGTGKTFLAENLVSKLALGRNYLTINCSQWTSPTEIIGGQTMDGYQEGKLIEAWKNGYVLILDELPKIDPNTAGLFNDALAKTKVTDSVIFNSRRESFHKHPDFACIATGNIYPDKESITYGANNRQDLSLLDRFSGSVYFIEKNPSIERQIIQNDMLWSICNQLRSSIEELKYEAQLSLRFMQNARDAFLLEMSRVKDKQSQVIKGKTFKSAIESFLSTFTEIQRNNLKDKIQFESIFEGFAYRDFPLSKMVF